MVQNKRIKIFEQIIAMIFEQIIAMMGFGFDTVSQKGIYILSSQSAFQKEENKASCG